MTRHAAGSSPHSPLHGILLAFLLPDRRAGRTLSGGSREHKISKRGTPFVVVNPASHLRRGEAKQSSGSAWRTDDRLSSYCSRNRVGYSVQKEVRRSERYRARPSNVGHRYGVGMGALTEECYSNSSYHSYQPPPAHSVSAPDC